MKKRWIDLVLILLSCLLILIQILALNGYWYNGGNAFGLIAAVLLLVSAVLRYRCGKREK